MEKVEKKNVTTSVFWLEVRKLFLTNDDVEQVHKPTCSICASTMVLNVVGTDKSETECPGMVITPCGQVVGLRVRDGPCGPTELSNV